MDFFSDRYPRVDATALPICCHVLWPQTEAEWIILPRHTCTRIGAQSTLGDKIFLPENICMNKKYVTLWPIKLLLAHFSPTHLLNWSNRKYRHSIRRPRKSHPRTKHGVNRTIRRGDMAIWNFPKKEVGRRSVGRSSIYTSYTDLIYSSSLRYIFGVRYK